MQHFDKTFKATPNAPLNIHWINEYCKNYPKEKILVEVNSTIGLNSKDLEALNNNVWIRIAGAYDEDRQNRYKREKFGNETCEEYYYESVIYSKLETIRILEAIEEMEKGLSANWTNLQKIVYIYDYLKRHITYDPKYEQKPSKEVRSLRGLITKQTVCAGYSLILKELLERQRIKCHYVRGHGHAWNIIEEGGKLYPVDLTWENSKFRSGESKTYDYLGKEIEEFNKNHIPDDREPMNHYQHKLSVFNSTIIRQMDSILNRERDYQTTTYHATRKDKSEFQIAQVGTKTIEGVKYYRYYYQEILPNGKKGDPKIFYSESNISNYIDKRKFGHPVNPEYEHAITDVLFSKENIEDSEKRNTGYIGRVTKEEDIKQIYKDYHDIPKPLDKIKRFHYPTRVFHRKDGTVFIAQRTIENPSIIGEDSVYQYDLFEITTEKGKEVLKKNVIFTEKPFLGDFRSGIADDYLSRSRIDRKIKEAGGYMGYYDQQGFRNYNPRLNQYFDRSKKIEEKPRIQIPTFEECKDLVTKYEIDAKTNKVVKKGTHTNIDNKDLEKRAYFANLWLSAAGVKVAYQEDPWGYQYAFNEPAEELYRQILNKFQEDIEEKGTIDTEEMFHQAGKSSYKYAQEIILRLCKTPSQVYAINDLFHEAIAPDKIQTKDPEALYDWAYIGSKREERNY